MTRRLGDIFYSHPFLVTFRIDRTTTTPAEYSKRLTALGQAVDTIATGAQWKEPTSCFVFESNYTIDEIAACLARAIDHAKDLVLVVRNDGPEAIVLGKDDAEMQTLRTIFPHARKVG